MHPELQPRGKGRRRSGERCTKMASRHLGSCNFTVPKNKQLNKQPSVQIKMLVRKAHEIFIGGALFCCGQLADCEFRERECFVEVWGQIKSVHGPHPVVLYAIVQNMQSVATDTITLFTKTEKIQVQIPMR